MSNLDIFDSRIDELIEKNKGLEGTNPKTNGNGTGQQSQSNPTRGKKELVI